MLWAALSCAEVPGGCTLHKGAYSEGGIAGLGYRWCRNAKSLEDDIFFSILPVQKEHPETLGRTPCNLCVTGAKWVHLFSYPSPNLLYNSCPLLRLVALPAPAPGACHVPPAAWC